MKSIIGKLTIASLAVVTLAGCASTKKIATLPEEVTINRSVLMDKVKGAWAGQTIGCTYGGPTEFKFRGTMIQPYHPIRWRDGNIKDFMSGDGGLYDDIYMDLTFVEVFDRLGLDAPVDSFAMAYAHAGYGLWHANQAGRYNIMHGIMPPASGHWLNNPHADDIDYQIEADYSGIMSPGMPNAAAVISDKIGHIMNSGDGWYGGVYVGALYSLAFVCDDMEFVVSEALKVIPQESKFYQCIHDVIEWYHQYPNDWKQTWFEVERKYSEDLGCPDGVFVPYNIDATVNSAYVVIGLLYGKGDFFKTMDIATRCGQDSDCNPSTAAGILGAMIGYDRIPEFWMKNLREAEDINFAYTTSSLKKTYDMSFRHALQMIERHGGKVTDNDVTISVQRPQPVKLEKNFEGMYPILRRNLNKFIDKFGKFEFEGNGFILRGSIKSPNKNYEADVSVFVDGNLVENAKLPVSFTTRRQELCWKYMLPKGKHVLTLKWNNPEEGAEVHCGEVIVYDDAPVHFDYK